MPNGNPEIAPADWERIRAFFAEISRTLLDFASQHNLAIDEYYHESPSWSFRFQHPKGGGGTVHVERLNNSMVRLNGSWYVDDYETFTRHFKGGPNHDFPLKHRDLRKELEACFAQVVGWEENDLTPYADYKKAWSAYSKEEWNRIFSPERLPPLRP